MEEKKKNYENSISHVHEDFRERTRKRCRRKEQSIYVLPENVLQGYIDFDD